MKHPARAKGPQRRRTQQADKSRTLREYPLQKACADYLHWLEKVSGLFTFYAVPNGGGRSKADAGQLKAMGVRAGVPDLVILFYGGRSLYVELKYKGGSASADQREFHKHLRRLGFAVEVIEAERAGDAIGALADLLRRYGIREATVQ